VVVVADLTLRLLVVPAGPVVLLAAAVAVPLLPTVRIPVPVGSVAAVKSGSGGFCNG
jgi:hypothetical protein